MCVLLVDFSNFVNVCWWPAVNAQDADPKYDAKLVLRTNIEHKMSTMDAAMEGLHNYKVIFVEDRPPRAKNEIYPLYKANRPPKDFDPRPLAKEYLAGKGQFLWSEDNEADDTIATLVRRIKCPSVIVSSDKDLWQLLRPGVRIWSPSSGKFVDEAAILKAFGVTNPEHIPLVKALWGDAGDNVPNAIPRMQKQLLPLVRLSDGTLADMSLRVARNYAGMSPRCRQLYVDGWPQVEVNYQLVKLNDNVILDGEPFGQSVC
jgi:5'-3' exonuclease